MIKKRDVFKDGFLAADFIGLMFDDASGDSHFITEAACEEIATKANALLDEAFAAQKAAGQVFHMSVIAPLLSYAIYNQRTDPRALKALEAWDDLRVAAKK